MIAAGAKHHTATHKLEQSHTNASRGQSRVSLKVMAAWNAASTIRTLSVLSSAAGAETM